MQGNAAGEVDSLKKTVGIGHQNFEQLILNDNFYIDKTAFIKEWWESNDIVTLITRPRRFGKTLNMSMLEYFFSINYKEKKNLFEGLSIWEDDKYQQLQGTYPVISLSFSNVKEPNLYSAKRCLFQILSDLYDKHIFLLDSPLLTKNEKDFFLSVTNHMDDTTAIWTLHKLSDFLSRLYGQRVIVLLDEYDTPMQEAYINGYWDDLLQFIRSFFNSTFKTNPYLERAVMTGITRIGKESIFSDLNHPKVITTSSAEYADCFGFTESEVFGALDEFGMSDKKMEVKKWYDGFTFGRCTDIYNPWSIINFLDTGEFDTYWANTSSNSLAGKLIREGNREVKKDFEKLLSGEHLHISLDEQIVYDQLDFSEMAVWSLLLASGYLKIVRLDKFKNIGNGLRESAYELDLTNFEVKLMFYTIIRGWFQENTSDYNDFIKALLVGDVDAMNDYMNSVAQSVFSYFDTGKNPSRDQPKRFYHGFVLGLMVELQGRYVLTSNRESGFGRYDVMLEPLHEKDDAMILEFKVFQPRKENTLADTVKSALQQINDRHYETFFLTKGISKERIRKYGFAFSGKEILIGSDD